MPGISIEEAVKKNCQAVVAGDLANIMGDLTADALGNLLANARSGPGTMPAITGFSIDRHEETGGDHTFTVKFAGEHDFTTVATWRDVSGAWKIADLKIDQSAGGNQLSEMLRLVRELY
ncbi:MAG: hypothetical protein HY873_04110 [Chloroflexi bacterium]|nr:hypothetical protein [Chloroflexota bacterium]